MLPVLSHGLPEKPPLREPLARWSGCKAQVLTGCAAWFRAVGRLCPHPLGQGLFCPVLHRSPALTAQELRLPRQVLSCPLGQAWPHKREALTSVVPLAGEFASRNSCKQNIVLMCIQVRGFFCHFSFELWAIYQLYLQQRGSERSKAPWRCCWFPLFHSTFWGFLWPLLSSQHLGAAVAVLCFRAEARSVARRRPCCL